jgi:hypothetical protein
LLRSASPVLRKQTAIAMGESNSAASDEEDRAYYQSQDRWLAVIKRSQEFRDRHFKR